MQELSAFPGVTRRQFLKLCGGLAALIGLGQAGAADVAAALEALAKRPAVVWSLFQECLGCSVNLLQSRAPDPATLILRTISLNYHEAVMAAAGDQADALFWQTVNGGDFYYIVEGAIATKIPEAMTVHGRTAADIAKTVFPKAKATIAIGSCATYGNIQAAHPNPTGAKGLAAFLREDGGFPNATVINISRCPGNADDLLATITYVLVHGKVPALDHVGRPVFLYGQLIHDNCERRPHFENGQFVEAFGDEGAQKHYCWYKMGCKGPVTYAPCPVTRWNGRLNWCIGAGPCIGCAEPGFWDTLTPFYGTVPNIHLPGIGGVSDKTVAEVLGIGTAVGIGAHFVGQAVTHRVGHGALPEGGEPPQASEPPEPPAPPTTTAGGD
jgi:hydrogenase small subunit